nr:hypothetical transcript [Hymenolepis microstoma]
MNVDMTNELKGWMQAIIIVYHYLNGYYINSIYILMRVFVSTYIALSGFGHFLYFWNKFSPKTVMECTSPKHLMRIYLALGYRYFQNELAKRASLLEFKEAIPCTLLCWSDNLLLHLVDNHNDMLANSDSDLDNSAE